MEVWEIEITCYNDEYLCYTERIVIEDRDGLIGVSRVLLAFKPKKDYEVKEIYVQKGFRLL